MPFKVIDILNDMPIDIATAKSHLRYTGTREDDNINRYIQAAIKAGENRMWRAILHQRIRLTMDAFPVVDFEGNAYIELPRPPLVVVESVKYWYGDTQLTLSPSEYRIDSDSEPAVLEPVTNWPVADERRQAVEIVYTCGYPTIDTIPPTILEGIQLLMAHFFKSRESVAVAQGNVTVKEIPDSANYLFDMHSVRTP